MLRLIRHFLFTVAMIAWAGLCVYLMEKAQQVPVASYLNPLLSVFDLEANTIEIAQSAYQAITGALLVLLMLFPGFLYKKSFPV
ncbi:MAG: hypothetical protein EBT08_15760 [Betaproteobacteria bacterium]|nr:hypothetical protein [Betaproteobacteria bacterium]